MERKKDEKIETQRVIINGLCKELEDIFEELRKEQYKSVDENRTYNFKSNQLIDDIFKLCISNYIIGKLDRQKIKSSERGWDAKKIRNYILQVRDYLEFRSFIKNRIEYEIYRNRI
ncbi:MAG TPA: hypothetical protein PLC59_11690 [Bacteroidales bacterium]|nr:hypothetical protein [Bacteroidales bacterium]